MLDILQSIAKLETLAEFASIGRSIYSFAQLRPKPKQSVAFGKGRAFTPTKTRHYVEDLKNQLNQNWSANDTFTGPVKVQVIFSYEFLKKERVKKFKITRPDVDNLMKPVQDSLQRVLVDDSQIALLEVMKIHSENHFIFVKIFEINYRDCL